MIIFKGDVKILGQIPGQQNSQYDSQVVWSSLTLTSAALVVKSDGHYSHYSVSQFYLYRLRLAGSEEKSGRTFYIVSHSR